jgi:MATE family multidrug resistance protein
MQSNKNKSCYTGSLKELCVISFPLMLSLMSSSLMFFADRLFLAQYSLEAHNAAASAGNIVSFLQFPLICTACISEVFVGQCSGSGDKKHIGPYVWQMIWLSLLSFLFFFPAAAWGGDYLFGGSRYQSMEEEYFRLLMFSGPIYCLAAALSAFYIGRGSLRFITIWTIIANIVNAFLASVLISGFSPYIPPLGIKGAAIATFASQGLFTLVLLKDFLKVTNMHIYGTGSFAFCWHKFYECLRLGFPASLAHTIEIFAWALFFRMLQNVSDAHIATASIAQTILFLFTFLTEGISKGATVVASNMVGAKQWKAIWKLLFSGLKFYALAFIALSFFFVYQPQLLVQLFIPASEAAHSGLAALVASSCLWIWFFFLFDGIHWLVVGLLTAVGDTKFVLKIGSSMIWVCALLPTYLLIVKGGLSPDFAWAISALYALAICLVYLARFYNERWKESAQLMAA